MKHEDVLNFLKVQFDAEVKKSGNKRYRQTMSPLFDEAELDTYSRKDYVVSTQELIDISFTEPDLNRFIDFIAWLDDRCERDDPGYAYNNAYTANNGFGIRESPYVKHCIEKSQDDNRERRLRKENPALQDAWVTYRAMLALLK